MRNRIREYIDWLPPSSGSDGAYEYMAKRSAATDAASKEAAPDVSEAGMGTTFAQVMDEAGINTTALAAKITVNKDTITEWRKGNLTKATKDFRRACAELGVDADALMQGRIDRLNAGKLPAAPNRMLERLLASESHDRVLHSLIALYRDQFGSDDGKPGVD